MKYVLLILIGFVTGFWVNHSLESIKPDKKTIPSDSISKSNSIPKHRINDSDDRLVIYGSEFEYKGHEYIFFHEMTYCKGGVVHNPNCKKCKK